MSQKIELLDFCAVKDVVAALTQLEQQVLACTGLHLNQAFALCCLAQTSKTVGELAGQLKISGPSLSRIVKKLEAQALVQRRSAQADGRTQILELTPLGQAEAQNLLAQTNNLFPWVLSV